MYLLNELASSYMTISFNRQVVFNEQVVYYTNWSDQASIFTNSTVFSVEYGKF